MGINRLNRRELARMIDHTNLRAYASVEDIKRLCTEAKTHGFHCVVVNPSYVKLAYQQLDGDDVSVCCVVGFPLGAAKSVVKAFEARTAIQDGASEIDMVMNIGALKSGLERDVSRDIEAVVHETKQQGRILKVIIEACYLTDQEKMLACKLAASAGAHFVKSSTGYADGAKVEDIRLMRATVGEQLGVKAAGGIRSFEDVAKMIAAGADRIGTSSSVKIMQEFKQ